MQAGLSGCGGRGRSGCNGFAWNHANLAMCSVGSMGAESGISRWLRYFQGTGWAMCVLSGPVSLVASVSKRSVSNEGAAGVSMRISAVGPHVSGPGMCVCQGSCGGCTRVVLSSNVISLV